ncbi:MAG TPA: hypothetical protein PKD83_01565 [Ignavibacteria bacterium]|nr:hypothetical protein [Ignavibacteria bacterium]
MTSLKNEVKRFNILKISCLYICTFYISPVYVSSEYSDLYSSELIVQQYPDNVPTEITVIGTVHYETRGLISDTLLSIFLKIKPDVILFESDSTYFSSENEIEDDIKDEFLETKAITKYKESNSLKLIPYDIPGRDDYMNDYERVSHRANLFYDLNVMLKKKSYNDSLNVMKYYEILLNLSAVMSDTTITYINSIDGCKKIDSINSLTYEGIAEIIKSTPELSGYAEFWKSENEFWNKRNNVMLENILREIKIFSGKKVIVLCGFAHKKFLKSKISSKAFENYAVVKEFWEY